MVMLELIPGHDTFYINDMREVDVLYKLNHAALTRDIVTFNATRYPDFDLPAMSISINPANLIAWIVSSN